MSLIFSLLAFAAVSFGWIHLWTSTYRPYSIGGLILHNAIFTALSLPVAWLVSMLIMMTAGAGYSASNTGALGLLAIFWLFIFGFACFIALILTIVSFREKQSERKFNESARKPKIIADIFRTICGGKENTAAEIAECTSSPIEYAAKNAAQFFERGISPDDTYTDTLMWIGCVDILIKYKFAAELDFKCELEDLISELGKLTSHNFTPKEYGLDPNAYITIWLGELDELLKERGLCIGGIDIDSDSYVVFLTDIQTLGKLKDTANIIGHKIDYAKNL